MMLCFTHACEGVHWVQCVRCLEPAVHQSWGQSCSILACNSCLWPSLPSETTHNFCQSCCSAPRACGLCLVLSSGKAGRFAARDSSETHAVTGSLCLYMTAFVCCFAVGGVTSPWRGEYREPRRLVLHQENNPQTSLPPAVSPASATPDPEPAARGCCAGPAPPLALERAQQREGTRWNASRELSRIWDPPPLSSTPLPLKSCSHTERATTISEQELQQLEIGMEHAVALSSACPSWLSSHRSSNSCYIPEELCQVFYIHWCQC